MRWYQWVWVLWIAFGFGFEIVVLAFGIHGATLSEQIWKFREKSPNWFSLFLFFLAWMIYHFWKQNVSGGGEIPPLTPPLLPPEGGGPPAVDQ